MNNSQLKIGILFLLAGIISSCATTPELAVPQPWTRSMGNPYEIHNNAKIALAIHGSEEHLVLNNSLMDDYIYGTIAEQLSRRNFRIVSQDENPDYTFSVFYSSKDIERTRTEAMTSQRSAYQSYTGSGTGILAAIAVSSQAAGSASASRAVTSSYTAYRHTIGFSIHDNLDDLIWTGESTWECTGKDVSNRMITVTQILLSNIPGYGEFAPRINAVNKEKESNFIHLYANNRSFSGPALPYLINFETTSTMSSLSEFRFRGVETRIAYAVIDLIQTAEYAVPVNPDYNKPLASNQWNRVKLGGKYYLGNDYQPTYILVELRGSRNSYTIRSASSVSEREYENFKDDLKRWQQALSEYYDVFE